MSHNSKIPQPTNSTAHKSRSSQIPQLKNPTTKKSHGSQIPQLTNPTTHKSHNSQIPQPTNPTAHKPHSPQIPQLKNPTAHKSHSSQIPQPTNPTAHKSHNSTAYLKTHKQDVTSQSKAQIIQRVRKTQHRKCMEGVIWCRDIGRHDNRFQKNCFKIIYSVSYERKAVQDLGPPAESGNRWWGYRWFWKPYCPLNHVTYFGARESFIAFSGSESVTLSVMVMFCVKSWGLGVTKFYVQNIKYFKTAFVYKIWFLCDLPFEFNILMNFSNYLSFFYPDCKIL